LTSFTLLAPTAMQRAALARFTMAGPRDQATSGLQFAYPHHQRAQRKQSCLVVLVPTSDLPRRNTICGSLGCCSSVLNIAFHDWTAACYLREPGHPFCALDLGLLLGGLPPAALAVALCCWIIIHEGDAYTTGLPPFGDVGLWCWIIIHGSGTWWPDTAGLPPFGDVAAWCWIIVHGSDGPMLLDFRPSAMWN
jgi:hypothetical protein